MSSISVSSGPTLEPITRPPALIPQVDLTALAKTTRKTLERLVPFSHMRPASSEASPRLTKIIGKIDRYTNLIDSSMLCEQLGYQLANNCMVLCDPELSVGLSTPGGGKAGVAGRGRRGAWTPVGVSGQPGSADACVFGREDARELAGKGHEIALKVKEGFDGIAQEMYKIAASTKDDMLVVLVPPDPTHSQTLKINLKDVGTNLVASLSLLSEFSKAVSEVTDWWSSVKDDLASEESSLLVPTSSQHGDEVEQGVGNIESEKFAWWSEMKDNFQEYYDVINVVHLRFPELLPLSSAAWRSVALARSHVPSSTGQSNIPHQSQSNPVLAGVSGGGAKEHGKGRRLGTFRLGWKRVDKEKKKEEMKPKKRLVKRKISKEKSDGMANNKTKEVEGNTKDETEDEKKMDTTPPKLNKTENSDENNTRKESSQSSSSIYSNPSTRSTSSSSTSRKAAKEEKPETKVRMMTRSSMFWSNKLSRP